MRLAINEAQFITNVAHKWTSKSQKGFQETFFSIIFFVIYGLIIDIRHKKFITPE